MHNWTAQRWLLVALLILTGMRMAIGALSELSPDETYYFLWAERLDWSYYSKGPGVALAIKASTTLFGKCALGIRFLSPLLGFGSSWLLFLLGKRLVGENAALWAVVMLNFTPIFNAGSTLLTIDPLMIFFWIAGMLTFWKALQTESRSTTTWWILAGLSIGVGFLCKYTIIVLIISMVIYLLNRPGGRDEFRRAGFWLMVAVILVCTTPVLIWNFQNGGITFVHLIERTGLVDFSQNAAEVAEEAQEPSSGWNPFDVFAYYGQHLGVYSPIFFLGLTWATVRCWRRFRQSDAEMFLGSFSLPIVVFYFALSVAKMGELNWTAPGFIGLGLLMMKYWAESPWSLDSKRKIANVAYGIAAFMTVWALNPDTIRSVGLNLPYHRDPFWRLRGWETTAQLVADEVERYHAETGKNLFLISNRYQTAAALAFYFPEETAAKVLRPTQDHPLVHMFKPANAFSIKNQFAFWPAYYKNNANPEEKRFEKHDALFITDAVQRQQPQEEVTESFATIIEEGKTVPTGSLFSWFINQRHGQDLRGWKIFACHDFRQPE